jgi:putative molybdopterin biosynthesis protein
VRSEDVEWDLSGPRIMTLPPRGANVRQGGEDLRVGELLLPPGRVARAEQLPAVWVCGPASVEVHARPRVVVVPTGDEIVPLGSAALRGQTYDTTSAVVRARLEAAGAAVEVTDVQPDVADVLTDVVGRAAERADLVVIIAGTGPSRDDCARHVVAELGSVSVHGLPIRPGHPVLLGAVGYGIPTVALPGHPLASLVVSALLLEPAARLLAGLREPEPEQVILPAHWPGPSDLECYYLLALGEQGARVLSRRSSSIRGFDGAELLVHSPRGVGGLSAGSHLAVRLSHG